MSSTPQISTRHRDRLGVIYIRQPTLAQVREHTESSNRQYGLVEKATSLGWDASDVLVIDGDLGLSGRSSSLRPGFKELVSRVCVGEVGLRRVLVEYIEHYHLARPHRSLGLRAPLAEEDPARTTGEVVRRSRLRGLLHEYSRQAGSSLPIRFLHPPGLLHEYSRAA